MSLDPVIVNAAAASLAIVLLVGAWQKLRDVGAFEIAIDAYELLPPAASAPLARVLPLLEAAAGLLLLPEATRAAGVMLAAAVLGLVTAAVAINLRRGRTDVGCGCGGLEDEQTLSWALVARNGALFALLAAAAAAPAVRPLVWFDFLSVGAGALVLYGLYVVASQLIANAPRLARLRAAT